MAGVDSLASVHQLAEAVRGHAELRVLVEVDCGLRRSGVAPADAGRIAAAAARAGLAVDGRVHLPRAQLRAGHARPRPPPTRRPRCPPRRTAWPPRGCRARCAAAGPRPAPAGYQPGRAEQGGGAVTELRPGVYAFNDAQQVVLGSCTLDEVALSVLATVVSTPARGPVRPRRRGQGARLRPPGVDCRGTGCCPPSPRPPSPGCGSTTPWPPPGRPAAGGGRPGRRDPQPRLHHGQPGQRTARGRRTARSPGAGRWTPGAATASPGRRKLDR